MIFFQRFLRAGALATLAGAPVLSFAQSSNVVVSYAPLATSVPTLGEWTALGLAALVAAAALRALRKQQGSRVVMGLALAAAGLFGAMQGSSLVGNAVASIAFEMDNPAGGTVQLPFGYGVQPVTNTSGVPLRVLSVTPNNSRDDPATTCRADTVLPPGASCNVQTFEPT